LIFDGAVRAAIEIAVLGKMIEPLSRAVKSGSDVMPAIVIRKAIWLAGMPLLSS
jgi:hypothetical protein